MWSTTTVCVYVCTLCMYVLYVCMHAIMYVYMYVCIHACIVLWIHYVVLYVHKGLRQCIYVCKYFYNVCSLPVATPLILSYLIYFCRYLKFEWFCYSFRSKAEHLILRKQTFSGRYNKWVSIQKKNIEIYLFY